MRREQNVTRAEWCQVSTAPLACVCVKGERRGKGSRAAIPVAALRELLVVAVGAEDGVVLRGEVLVGERRLARLAHEALLVPVLVLVVQVLRANESTLLSQAETQVQVQAQAQARAQVRAGGDAAA